MKITAYFHNAQTTRMAKNAMEHLGLTVSDPIPVTNGLAGGRPWSLEITIGHPSPTLEDQAVGLIMRYDGITSEGN